MSWSALFLINIAQGLFLLSLLVLKGSKNVTASWLIATLIVLMILANLGYLVIRTDLVNYVPQLFGVPFGMMFLFGPLFYLYCHAVVDVSFRWKDEYWVHFVPYLIQLYINLPWLMADRSYWVEFVNVFLAGNMPIRDTEKVLLMAQNLHLLIYLLLTFRWIREARSNFKSALYIITISSRIRWLTILAMCFSVFLLTVFSMGMLILLTEKYNPITNYMYTAVTSVIIYFIAYQLVLNPQLISPDFTQKYKAYMQFMGEDGEKHIQKLKSLMNESKVFVNPEFSLSLLADSLGLPSHQVSKLINEKFGKSFNDLVNEYRVREFISRINHPEYQSYSVLGVGLDVGFNSKSSFNSAFKKITGKTPSEFRKEV